MMREADMQSRAVENVEAMMKRSLQQAKVDEEKEQAKFERKIQRMEKEDGEAMRKLERIEREEKARLANEERLGAKQLQLARREVDIAKRKANHYQTHRVALEAATGRRLWQEADAMRHRAMHSGGTLSEEDVLHLLDVTKPVLDRMTWNMNTWGPDDTVGFEERLDGVRSKSAAASAKMLEAVKHKVEVFHNDHLDYDTRQFLGLLARLFNDTKSEIGDLQQTTDAILGRQVRWDGPNPERFTYTVAMALKGITGNVEFRNRLLKMDTARLSQANATEACRLLGGMLEFNLQPAYRSLGRMRDALDNMSRIVPSVGQDMPVSAQATVANRTANVLNMAYAEHMAFTEAATALMQEVTPVVLERLHCDLKSASLPSRIGTIATALIVAAIALLAQ
jgi:hypothetical protein